MEDFILMLDRLKEMISKNAFLYNVDISKYFKLNCGVKSPFYFNLKKVMLDPEGIYLIGKLIYERIRKLDVTAVGGMEVGCIPIATAVSIISYMEGKPLKQFYVKNRLKDHGVDTLIVGVFRPDDRLVVVEDVVTTGGSSIKAMEALNEANLKVVKVITIVDRQELDGKANIEKLCPDYEALVNREEIVEMYNLGKLRESGDK